MNRRRFLFLVAAVLPSSLLAHAAREQSDLKIVCFGDSITAGYGIDPGHTYPDYLQGDLNAGGYQYRVVNLGVSGNTTKDGIERLSEAVSLHPAIVIVEFGGNDGLRGLPITATRANLDTIVATLLKAGSKVVLMGITLPPNYGGDYIRQFDAMFGEVASKYHIRLMPMLYAHVYGVPGAIQQDGVHPTAEGARMIATNIVPLLLPLLRR